MSGRPIVLAISGASGAAYAVRLLEVLLAAGRDVHLTISRSAALVIREELGCDVDLKNFAPEQLLSPSGARECSVEKLDLANTSPRGKIHYYHYENLMAGIASGSFLTAGMVICPCSGGTLGAIVHGTGDNLIHRAAQVHLKERRKLILTPRETPLSIVQLENMKRAAEAGAIVLPAMPGFYHGARTIADLVDFIVARICDQLEVEHNLMRRWGT
jgi:4-hydroxy-3-polyprenylbenzoate decarboxylase